MSCTKWLEKIGAYADGEMGAAESAEILAHLRACPGCRGELAQVREMKSAMKSLSAPEFPASSRQALLAEARRLYPPVSQRRWWQGFPGLIRPRPSRAFAAAGAAACAVALAAGYAHFRSRPRRVPIQLMLAAHEEYALSEPLAPREIIYSRLPGQLSAAEGGADGGETDAL